MAKQGILYEEPCTGCGQLIDPILINCPYCGRVQGVAGVKRQWNFRMRFRIYVALRKQFGDSGAYSRADKESRNKALRDIADELNSLMRCDWVTQAGVDEQVSWAIRTPGKIDKRRSLIFFHNRSAAHTAGFIDSRLMDVDLVCEWANKPAATNAKRSSRKGETEPPRSAEIEKGTSKQEQAPEPKQEDVCVEKTAKPPRKKTKPRRDKESAVSVPDPPVGDASQLPDQ